MNEQNEIAFSSDAEQRGEFFYSCNKWDSVEIFYTIKIIF